MSKKPRVPRSDPAGQVLNLLTKIQSKTGHNLSVVFRDWVSVVRIALLAVPAHRASLALSGILAEDGPSERAMFDRVLKEYGKDGYEAMSEAFAMLVLHAADEGKRDLLGQIYMAIRSQGVGSMLGQFFTPYEVSALLGIMTAGNVHEMVGERLRTAGEAAGLSEDEIDSLVAGPGEHCPEAAWLCLLQRCGPHYRAIRICEPCCGSGGMILAIADGVPEWIIKGGLVVFYLNDIDYFCVEMAHVNMLVHGLAAVLTRSDVLSGDQPVFYGASPAEADRAYRDRAAAAAERQSA